MPQYCAKAMKPDIIAMKYIFKYLYFVRGFKTCHSAFSGFVISPSGRKTHKKAERVKKKKSSEMKSSSTGEIKMWWKEKKNNNRPYTAE